jgi:membrane-associated PAP2 superfamily phosphatase
MSPVAREFWWRQVRWPLAAFVPIAIVLAFSDLDISLANALFFDTAHVQWTGAHNFWIESFIHTGGRWAIRVLVLVAIGIWLATFRIGRWRAIRRTTAYFIVATVLGIGIVGLLKTITNVDCPWDLVPFGGRLPVVHLFADRPDSLRPGRCFPAAHASSGYALVALYFALCEWNRTLAKSGLTLGLACGVVFGLAQQSRGAHFMSHDLWSAFVVWLVAVSVYAFAFSMRLRTATASGVADGTLGGLRDRIDAVRRRDSSAGKAGPDWDIGRARGGGAYERGLPHSARDGGRGRAADGTTVVDSN